MHLTVKFWFGRKEQRGKLETLWVDVKRELFVVFYGLYLFPTF